MIACTEEFNIATWLVGYCDVVFVIECLIPVTSNWKPLFIKFIASTKGKVPSKKITQGEYIANSNFN